MCGIVGAVADRDVTAVLLEGLRRLEYRGYDSAGMVTLGAAGFERRRVQGKIDELSQAVAAAPLPGPTGLAHTRWATHGRPSVTNAHPHISRDAVALVHNGIIENHAALRARQLEEGYTLESDTDTEVVANLVHRHFQKSGDLATAVRDAAQELEGAYALGVLHRDLPDRLVASRKGSPLVIGVGEGEHFIASDIAALLPVTQRFIVLEEGDIAELGRERVIIRDRNGERAERPVITSELSPDSGSKEGYRHYMAKEIFTQPQAIAATLDGRLEDDRVIDAGLDKAAAAVMERVDNVHIVACGSSYHAGLIARYWLERRARLQCSVEIASEYRYRNAIVPPNTLLLVISQSGETLDVLEALRLARNKPYLASMAVCNVPESSLTREADLVFFTRAGLEVGVAATKTFTTQLAVLLMLTAMLARRRGAAEEEQARLGGSLRQLPALVERVLALDEELKKLAAEFLSGQHALFLGRGAMWPVAMEGALKMKEVSYIHAEAYAAGELKHGPLALIDDDMPIIAVAPKSRLLSKLFSNLQEVKARGARLYLFSDADINGAAGPVVAEIAMPSMDAVVAPIVYTVPLQLLSYHVAVLKGADVDQPRNLAKSVTVE